MEEQGEQSPPAKRQRLEETIQTSKEVSQPDCEASTTKEDAESRNNSHLHLMENDVGITEYISPQLPGFFAILKQR